jgi:hypothetical protein
MEESNTRERESLESLLPLTESIIASIDALPAAYAQGVLRAIRAGDTRTIDDYFRKQLGREPTRDGLVALFTILSRSPTWRKVKGLDLTKYLGRSVWLESRRIRGGWEREGTLTPGRRAMERRAALELERRRTRILSPDRLLARLEASEFRAHVLARVLDRVHQEGSDRDREILELLDRGLSPSEVVSHLGAEWSAWEAFRRKIKRWGAKERTILWSKMSSRRVSAA